MKTIFVTRLRELANGSSVSEFARRVGLPQQTVDRYLKEERTPNGENIAQICTRLGVSADWLLGLDSGDSSGGCAGCRERDAALAALSDTVRHLTEALRRGKGA